MVYEFQDHDSGGTFLMTVGEPTFTGHFSQDSEKKYNAIVWNRGPAQQLILDEAGVDMPNNSFFALNVNHSFRLERPTDAVIWQFNKPFYCIITHDAEVSCVGLLFYGSREREPILLDEVETRSLDLLSQVFKEEYGNRDNIQGEMLRVLLKRLIIKLTRLLKIQSHANLLTGHELDMVRQFNVLVEGNYKKLHQVKQYAALLHKSPKTLSNVFAKYHDKGPLQIIADRIFLESQRLLLYTDKSTGEIGYELGFEEPAHFSRFFKKMQGESPSFFRQKHRPTSTV